MKKRIAKKILKGALKHKYTISQITDAAKRIKSHDFFTDSMLVYIKSRKEMGKNPAFPHLQELQDRLANYGTKS